MARALSMVEAKEDYNASTNFHAEQRHKALYALARVALLAWDGQEAIEPQSAFQ